ncbi:sialidase family protein [Mariniphaga anaerophila]|nr:sialidase family protein [Mariniphaga anaerophila]
MMIGWLLAGFLILSMIFNTACGTEDEPVVEEKPNEVVVEGTHIIWDSSSLRKITDGNYARIRELDNQQLIAVYSRSNHIYIKYSDDQGSTWENEQLLAEGDANYIMTNAEAIQLANKSIVVGLNRRVKDERWGSDYTYGIMIVSSDDYGQTWSEPQLIYNAGNSGDIGCWEPAFLQLPDGELQCYFANEYPYPNTNEQEISLLRSFDNGESWTAEIETATFAQGARDGMPVPILDGDNILLAIEDNSNNHVLQPTIIKEPVSSNWKNGLVGSNDSRRFHAVPDFSRTRYAGAPYLAKLNSGELILSFQDRNEREKNFETMKVLVGESVIEPFDHESEPFAISKSNSAKWNSLCVLSSGEVIAVTSTNAYGKGIYMVIGEVVNNSK